MEKTRCPLRLVVILKNHFFILLNFTAESVSCSLFSKNLEKIFLQLFGLQKKNFVKHIETLPQHLSEIIYRLPISLQEIEIYRLSVSPRSFFKLSITVIASAQKGLSSPSLVIINLT